MAYMLVVTLQSYHLGFTGTPNAHVQYWTRPCTYHFVDACLVEVCLLCPLVLSLPLLGSGGQSLHRLVNLIAVHLLVAQAEVRLEDRAPRLLRAARVHR